MLLTRLIPELAMPVIEVLRRDVKKPKKASKRGILPLGFDIKRDWEQGPVKQGCCPMGLHKHSLRAWPSYSGEFAEGECSDSAVQSFGRWWDAQRNAKAAINAIWGKR